MSDPKVTFNAETWVWLEVRGSWRKDWDIRDDGGLSHRMLQWMNDEGIDWRAQRTGGGVFVGRIPVEDAPRVTAWLKENGASNE